MVGRGWLVYCLIGGQYLYCPPLHSLGSPLLELSRLGYNHQYGFSLSGLFHIQFPLSTSRKFTTTSKLPKIKAVIIVIIILIVVIIIKIKTSIVFILCTSQTNIQSTPTKTTPRVILKFSRRQNSVNGKRLTTTPSSSS